MIKFIAKTEGFDKAARRIALLDDAVKRKVVVAIHRSTTEMLHIAQTLVPKKTGELAGTLRTRFTKSGLAGFAEAGFGAYLNRRVKGESRALARVRKRKGLLTSSFGPALPGVYAPVVEFGDRKRNHRASPFLVPALEFVKPRHVSRINEAIREGLAEIAAGAA